MNNSIINNKILRIILLIHNITTIKHNKYNKIYAIRLPTKYQMSLSLILYLQSDLPQYKEKAIARIPNRLTKIEGRDKIAPCSE